MLVCGITGCVLSCTINLLVPVETPLWRHGVVMTSALVSGSSSPGLSLGRGHCFVFFGKTLYSHSASLHPGVQIGTGKLNAAGNPVMD